MRIASALFSVMSLVLLQYSVSDDMALFPIAEYEQFWGLQSQLMLPFAIQGNPMDLSFDSLQEPSIVAKAYMEKLSTLRGNISRSVSLMGCPDEFCSEALQGIRKKPFGQTVTYCPEILINSKYLPMRCELARRSFLSLLSDGPSPRLAFASLSLPSLPIA